MPHHYRRKIKVMASSTTFFLLTNSPVNYSTDQWIPIPELLVTDGVVTVLFLSSNDISFINKTTDPWYSAQTFRDNSPDDGSTPHYDAGFQLWQDPTQQAYSHFSTFFASETPPSIKTIVTTIRTAILQSCSTLFIGTQSFIQDDQWELDIQNFFKVMLASLQRVAADQATGPACGPAPDSDTTEYNRRVECLRKPEDSKRFLYFYQCAGAYYHPCRRRAHYPHVLCAPNHHTADTAAAKLIQLRMDCK
ncbi:hypothetical protein V8E54_009183 [Elaphomyces granulatus]